MNEQTSPRDLNLQAQRLYRPVLDFISAPYAAFRQQTDGPMAVGFRALLVVAGVSTGAGLWSYVSERASFGTFAMLTVVVITFVFTLVMAFSIERTFDGTRSWSPFRYAMRYFWMTMYFATLATSLCFAFAFWWTLLQADSATSAAMQRDYSGILSKIQETRGAMDAAATTLNKLAGNFKTLDEQERSKGGSCPGNGSPAGAGPIRQLRESEATVFASVASAITDANTSLQNAIRESTPAIAAGLGSGTAANQKGPRPSPEEVRVALNGLRSTAQGSIAVAKGYGGALTTAARNHRTETGFTGTGEFKDVKFSCIDEASANLLDSSAKALSDVPVIPEATFTEFKGSKATSEAVVKFLSTFGLGMFIPEIRSEGLTRDDAAPFILAFFVDLTLLGLGIERAKRENRLQRAERRETERYEREAARSLTSERIANERVRLDAAIRRAWSGRLTELMVSRNGWQFFVVPTVIDGPARILQRDIINFLHFFDRSNSPIMEFRSFRFLMWHSYNDKLARKLLRGETTPAPFWRKLKERLGVTIEMFQSRGNPPEPSGAPVPAPEEESDAGPAPDDQPESETAGADRVEIDWARGSDFRWFRLNRRYARAFVHALELYEDEMLIDGSDFTNSAASPELEEIRLARAQQRVERARTKMRAESTARAQADTQEAARRDTAKAQSRVHIAREKRTQQELAFEIARLDAEREELQHDAESQRKMRERVRKEKDRRDEADLRTHLARLRKEADSIKLREDEIKSQATNPSSDGAFTPDSKSALASLIDALIDRLRDDGPQDPRRRR